MKDYKRKSFIAFYKVVRVLQSCQTIEQLSVARRMKQQFYKLYPKINKEYYVILRKIYQDQLTLVK